MQRLIDALRTSKLSHALAAIFAALVAAGVTIVIDTAPEPGHHVVTVHVGKGSAPTVTKVDTGDPGRTPDKTISVPVAAAKQVAATELGNHLDLRTENPPGVTPPQLEASQVKQEQLATTDQLPLVQPDAAPEQRGCVSRFVRNYSTRRGVRPREWTLHYTVSPNRPGWSDVDAVVNLFNSASSQASSNYVIDSEGNCAYIVRESDKAWTQAGGNPYSISVEVIDTGRESHYMDAAGLQKLAMVISDSAKRWDIPIQRGAVNGCVPTSPGIIQHKDWGLCGGGHFDISPFPVDPVIAAVSAYRAATTATVSSAAKTWCRRLTWWRTHGRPHGKPEHNAVIRRGLLARQHVTCINGVARR